MNYFAGDSSTWLRDVPAFGRLVYQGVYDGVDLVWHPSSFSQRQWQFDYVVNPGVGDHAKIRFRLDGATDVRLRPDGSLRATTRHGELVGRSPVLYQVGRHGRAGERHGERVPVAGRYRLHADGTVGFEVTGNYDRSRPLVIDPTLSYTTRAGGAGDDWAHAVAVDAAGEATAVGWTAHATGGPIAVDENGHPLPGGTTYTDDAFAVKFNAQGTLPVYLSYIGGVTGTSQAEDVALTAGGDAVLVGTTDEEDFPIVGNGFQGSPQGGVDGFVARLDAATGDLVAVTRLGGGAADKALGVAVKAGELVHVTGSTRSGNFPAAGSGGAPLQAALAADGQDAFVAVLTGDLTGLVWSTYLDRGTAADEGRSVAVDRAPAPSDPHVYVGGTFGLVKVAGDGSAVVASNALAGTGIGTVEGVARGADGAVYAGGGSAFAYVRADWAAPAVVSLADPTAAVEDLDVDGGGYVYVAGRTGSGAGDAFARAFYRTAVGSAWVYTPWWGQVFTGSAADTAFGVAVGGDGSVYVAGEIASQDFQSLPPFPGSLPGARDAFVAKILPAGGPPPGDPVVELAVGDGFGTEYGPDGLSFVLTRTGGDVSQALAVTVGVGGTASSEWDYTGLAAGGSVTVLFDPFVDSVTLDLTPVDDRLGEWEETVELTLLAGTGYVPGGAVVGTGVIFDDGDAPVAVEVVSLGGASEAGPTVGTFLFSIPEALDAPLEISYAVGGTAADGDYAGLARGPRTVVLDPGQTAVLVAFEVVDDAEVEAAETVTATLVEGVGYTFAAGSEEAAAEVAIDDDDAEVWVGATYPDAAEAAGATPAVPGTFTVYRRGSWAGDLAVSYQVRGSATAGDYDEVLTGTVVIPDGAASAEVTVTPKDDTLVEGIETVDLVVVAGAGYSVGSPRRATVTIADPDAVGTVLTVAAPTAETREGGAEPGVVAFYRTGDLTEGLWASYIVGGAADWEDHHEHLAGYVYFRPGSDVARLTVTPVDDARYEGDEDLTVTLIGGGAYTIGSASVATLTLVDNDAQIEVEATDSVAAEGQPGDPGTFTLTRAGDTTGALAVAYTLGGTAVAADHDAAAFTGVATFAAGATTVVLNVLAAADGLLEGNEALTLTLATGAGYVIGPAGGAAIVLADAEAAGQTVVTVAAVGPDAAEAGARPGRLLLMRTGPTTAALTVGYAVGGTASAGDYAEALGVQATFAAGEATVELTVTPADDSAAEGAETVLLTLAGGVGYVVGPAAAATVTILDDDVDVSVSATDPLAREGLPADPGTFTLTRAGGDLTRPLTVFYAVGGTASAADGVGLGTEATFAAGEAAVVLTYRPLDDRAIEPEETVVLTVQAAPAYRVVTASATLTVRDDDQAVAVAATTPATVEGSVFTPAIFTLTRTGDTAGALTVAYTLHGSVDPLGDVEPLSGTVTFGQGSAEATVAVYGLADATVEGVETLTLTVLAGAAHTVVGAGRATAFLADDAPGGTPVVAVAALVPQTREGSADPASFLLTRTGPTTAALTVTYTVGGTAGPADLDPALTGSVTFEAGQATVELPVAAADDALAEGPEGVTVTLQPEAGYVVGEAVIAEVDVLDDEWAVTVAATTPTTAEAAPGQPGVFTIRRSEAGTEALVVRYRVAGTASAGLDYAALAGTATIPAGQLSVTVDVTPVADALDEDDEAVTVVLLATDGYAVGTDGQATVTITDAVPPGGNAPPDATDDEATSAQGEAVTVAVLANDTDANADPLTLTIAVGPSHGTAAVDDNGTPGDPADDRITYTPTPGYRGQDAVVYQVADGHGGQDRATLTIRVNAAPVAVADAYATAEGEVLLVPSAGLLGNDTDADGDKLTASVFTDPAHGELSVGPDGAFRYRPNFGFAGTDTFTYRAWDGAAYSAPATVTLTVAGVNHAPWLSAEGYSVDQGDILEVSALDGLFQHAGDPDGDPIELVLVAPASHGALAVEADGSFTYTPAVDFWGLDTFQVAVSDGELQSGPVTVQVWVVRVNQDPVAEDDSATTTAGVAVDVFLLDNDDDPDADALFVRLLSDPGRGTVALGALGVATYTPAPGEVGVDGFQYEVRDGRGGFATAWATIDIDNSAPAGMSDSYTVHHGVLVVNAQNGVLANDTDPDDDDLTAALLDQATKGTVTLQADGSFRYVANAGTSGADTFTYQVRDGVATAGPVTVSITVTAANQAPAAAANSYTIRQGGTLVVGAAGVLANDTDADGDALTAALVIGPADGELVFNADGSFVYQPDADFSGTDAFSYRASDGAETSAAVTVTLTVTAVSGPLVAVDDVVETAEDVPVIWDPSYNDLGVHGGVYLAWATEPEHGAAEWDESGLLTYTPEADWHGEDHIAYTIADARGQESTGTITITVTPVNDDPVAEPDRVVIGYGDEVDIAVLDNDADPEGDDLTIDDVTEPEHGTATLDPVTRKITYRPESYFSGEDSFVYTVSDGEGGDATATVYVTVLAADAPRVSVVAIDDSARRTGPGQQEDTGTFRLTRTGSPAAPLTVYFWTGGTAVLLVGDEGDYRLVGDPPFGVSPPAGGLTWGSATFGIDQPTLDILVVPAPRVAGRPEHEKTALLRLSALDPEDPDADPTYSVPQVGGQALVVIGGSNRPPVAYDDTLVTGIGQTVLIDVLANDLDPDGDLLTIASVTLAGVGQAVLANDPVTGKPVVRYTAGPAAGTATIDYTVADGFGGGDVGRVYVSVGPGRPRITGFAPDTGIQNDNITSSHHLSLTGEGTPLGYVDVELDGTVIWSRLPVNAQGVWEFDYQNVYLPPGPRTFRARDAGVGAAGAWSDPFVVTVDSTPPTVHLQYLSDVYDRTPELLIRVSDNLGPLPDGTLVEIGFLDVTPTIFAPVFSGQLRDGALRIEWPAGSPLQPNVQVTIVARVADRAGNVGWSNRVTVVPPTSTVVNYPNVLSSSVVQEPAAVATAGYSFAAGPALSGGLQLFTAGVTYRSDLAEPKPTFQVVVTLPTAHPVPANTLSIELRLARYESDPRAVLLTLPVATQSFVSAGLTPGDMVTVRIQVPNALATGLYAWSVRVWDPERPTTYTTAKTEPQLHYVNNTVPSALPLMARPDALAAGWLFDFQDRIVPAATNSSDVVRVTANGFSLYQSTYVGPDQRFVSRTGDPGTLKRGARNWAGVPLPTGYTYTLPTGETKFYNAQGRLIEWINAEQTQHVVFLYDANGDLDKVYDQKAQAGSSLLYQFIWANQRADLTIKTARGDYLLHFAGPNASQLETITAPDGSVRTYVYDGNNRLKTATTAAPAWVAGPGLAVPAVHDVTAWGYNELTGAVNSVRRNGHGTTAVNAGAVGTGLTENAPWTEVTLPDGTVTRTQSSGASPTASATFNGQDAWLRSRQWNPDGTILVTTTQWVRSATSGLFTRVVRQYDARGRTTVYNYNEQDELTEVTRPGAVGNTTYVYGNVTVNAPNGPPTATHTVRRLLRVEELAAPGQWNHTVSTYSTGTGRLESTTSYVVGAALADRSVSYVYHVGGALDGLVKTTTTWVAAGEDLVVEYDYYDDRRLKQATHRVDGTTETYVYHDATRTQAVKDRADRRTTATVDVAGRAVASASPAGDVARRVYDALGRVHYEIDGVGRVTRYVYDGNGDLVRTAGAHLFDVVVVVRGPMGRVAAVVGPSAGRTEYVYEPVTGRHVGTVEAAGTADRRRSGRTFTPFGEVETETDALGRVTFYAYVQQSPTTTWRYDLYGTGSWQETEVVVDARGNTTYQRNHTTGAETTRTYNTQGELVKVWENTRLTTFRYDGLGRVVLEDDWRGTVTRRDHDDALHTAHVVEAVGRAGLERTTVVRSDAVGRQVEQTDAAGVATGTVYLDVVRTVVTVAAGPVLPAVTVAVSDAAGRVRRTVRSDATYATADYLDLLGVEWHGEGGLGGSRTSLSARDGAGRRVAYADPAGNVTSWGYDALGRPTSERDGLGIATTAYDAGDRVRRATDRAGQVRTFDYDLFDQVKREYWLDARGLVVRERTWKYHPRHGDLEEAGERRPGQTDDEARAEFAHFLWGGYDVYGRPGYATRVASAGAKEVRLGYVYTDGPDLAVRRTVRIDGVSAGYQDTFVDRLGGCRARSRSTRRPAGGPRSVTIGRRRTTRAGSSGGTARSAGRSSSRRPSTATSRTPPSWTGSTTSSTSGRC